MVNLSANLGAGVERLKVLGEEPLNAEPCLDELLKHTITPEELMYHRNHSDIPKISPEEWSLRVEGLVKAPFTITLDELKSKFESKRIVAALQCAGNRRQTMADVTGKGVSGILWGEATLANVSWTGVPLAEVLNHAGVDIGGGVAHVCFASHAMECQEDKFFGASIPLKTALCSDVQVLLAFEMNGKPLSPAHGAPVRLVVPGHSGARWVKWLDTIAVSREESPCAYQQRDYKILPPEVDSKATADLENWWARVPAIQQNPLISVIAPTPISRSSTGMVIRGYAVDGLSPISHVDVSTDGGKTWDRAREVYREGKWSWVIWEMEVGWDRFDVVEDGDGRGERREVKLISRAEAESGERQAMKAVWNVRGVGYCAVGEATFRV